MCVTVYNMTTLEDHLRSLMPSRELHEHFSPNEHLLRELVSVHPPCSMEMLRSEVLQLLASMTERKAVEMQSLPVVGKSYDDAYLRPPFEGERACVQGSSCMCNFLPKVRHGIETPLAFIGVEYMNPTDLEEWKSSGKLPTTHGRCLLCIRYVVTLLYTMARCNPRFQLCTENTTVPAAGLSASQVSDQAPVPRPRRRTKQNHASLIEIDEGEGVGSMRKIFDPMPTFTNAVNCVDGYSSDKVLFFEEEYANTRLMRETPMSNLAFRPFVRFCSTDYKFFTDVSGRPRIVQCGMASQRHLNSSAPSALVRMGAPDTEQPQN